MSATLYLLRQQPDQIPLSLFRPSDADMDIIFLERAVSVIPASMKGSVLSLDEGTTSDARKTLTYDDLVEKIFSVEHIIVI